MANKTINVQYKFRGDSLANLETKNAVYGVNEPIVVVIPADADAGTSAAVLLKLGDGVTAFKELPYITALAGDVPEWAKANTKPEYKAEEIKNIDSYIAGKVQDTDTQYKLEQDATDKHILKLSSKTLNDTDWTVIATITTEDTVYDDTDVKNDISDLTALIGTLPTTATASDIVGYVDEKAAAATYDDTALKARVKANEDAIGVLNGGATDEGSVAKQVADAVAKIVADAPEAYDTLKEISDWIASHASDASAMNTQITTNKNDIAALTALVGELPDTTDATTVITYIDEVIEGLKIGDYAKAADLTAAVDRITTAEGKIDTLEDKVADLEAIGATKVEASETNGNVKIDGTETEVYTLPNTVLHDTDILILDGGNA